MTDEIAENLNRTSFRDTDGLHKRRGIWHYKLKIDGHWKSFSTGTRSYQEARKLRQQAIRANEDGKLATQRSRLSFERAAEQWLIDRVTHVSDSTSRIDRERLVPLRGYFGNEKLCDISERRIREYQRVRAAQVSPRTCNLELKVLRMILKSAKLWSRVADGVAPLPEKSSGPGRALSPDQERLLFEVASSRPEWTAAFLAALLAANTTARGGELKGLRLGSIDFEQNCLFIRRSKTEAGSRVIPLNSSAKWALARLIERAQALGAVDPDHYLFPAFLYRRTKSAQPAQGTGYDPTRPQKTWRTAWRSLTKAAGLKGLRFHDLRHHSITKLAEAGVPEQTLMAIAGHVSREMLEHYSHIRMHAKRQAVAALEISHELPGFAAKPN
jgi:integrase